MSSLVRFVPILVWCVCDGSAAAEALPPLRVDPALLGGASSRPEAAPPPPRAPMDTEAPQVAPAAPAAVTPIMPETPSAPIQVSPPRTPAPAPKFAPATEPPQPTSPAEPALPTAPAQTEPADAAPTGPAAPAGDGLKPAPEVRQPGAASAAPTPADTEASPPLDLAPATDSTPPTDSETPSPVNIAADQITSPGAGEVVAEGNVELRQLGNTLNADRVTYWEDTDEVEAVGNVRLANETDVITGPQARLRLADSFGYFEQPEYSISRPPRPGQKFVGTGSGQAQRIDFEGEDRYRLKDATYSTCGPGNDDWYAKAGDLDLDFTREVGEARNARLVFLGVPFLYTPWLEFSLNNRRKSGFLPPTVGSSNRTGIEYTQPYYWNIAPNMDATFAPRFMTRRGLQIGAEARYLDYDYRGELHAEYLPNDRVTGDSRSLVSFQHAHDLGAGFNASLNLNKVSDDTYFTDLSTRIATTAQTNLLRQGVLSYTGGGWWSAYANIQRYQTLQDPALPPVAKPYDLLPQVVLDALRPDVGGFALALKGQYTDFSHPTLDNGRRLVAYPQVSWPFQTPSFYVTPKLGMHLSRYRVERRQTTGPDSLSRSVPIFSVDSGVTFERDTTWFGKRAAQTLEPRLYYLLVPERKQDDFPVFDTALADFNFAQIFSENIFSGNDRIGDANQLTAALTSRVIDPATGEEIVRAAIGQRFYFRDQTVTLPGVPARTGRTADYLAALSGRILPNVTVDTALQYNPRDGRTERLVAGASYRPGPTRVLNAGYRYQREVLREVDFSGQWPLYGRWYGVGRYNYSLRERRLVEAIAGLEYNGGCWVLRGVVQRFATATQAANTSFFVQLELNGFSGIGSNPLEVLKRNIPGYGKINQPASDPVFGSQ